MDTASLQFVLFGLIVAAISNFHASRAWRSSVLMLASFVFLVLLAHNPVALLPLFGFVFLGYLCLSLLQRGFSKYMGCILLIVIFAYIWLKKYTFLPERSFLHVSYFTLGLSYIFFRVLHVLIEAGEGTETRRIGVGSYLLYTLNFTTLVSGPI